MVGSAAVMAEQLDSLRSTVADVRVLPFSAGPPPLAGTCAMLAFDSVEDPSVVYVEGVGMARCLDKPGAWAEYDEAWWNVMDRAVPIGEWSP